MTDKTIAEVEAYLASRLGERLRLEPASFDRHSPFSRYGLDSLGATAFIAELAAALGKELSPRLAWQYPTIGSLADYLKHGEEKTTNSSVAPRSSNEPIAVIGMSCRFPQAASLKAFWQLLRNGVDAVTETPKERWDTNALYSPDFAAPGKMNSKWGGFLDQVDQFDAQFFCISPREAAQIDPQQRLMLELAWESLEDAGIAPSTLKDSLTGVFLGAMWQDYENVNTDRLAAIVQHTATGQNQSIISARVSYSLGLRGPSVSFNTACSAALVAVHYARRSLQLGECSLALAGGVNLLLAPESTVTMSKFGALSPDGRCKTFDSRANGYVRGEGGGVIVLKPLSQALASGDRVHCVLLGSAVNNNGFNEGLSAPSAQAQELLLRTAYADARVRQKDVQYVETHGTGTMLGDPAEAAALGATLGAGRDAAQPLIIGSVKTNIGHLEPASGIAGLIKATLALEHQEIPPNLHFQQPNPRIDFDSLRLQVPTATMPWPKSAGRPIAGVSSSGFGGTNCHVVVAGADAPEVFLLPLAAETESELYALAAKVHQASIAAADRLPLDELRAYLCTAHQGEHRLALLVGTHENLQKELAAFLAKPRPPGSVAAEKKRPSAPVLMFAGHGVQWLKMGAELLQIPAFRSAMERCDQALRPYLGSSLLLTLLSDQEAWLADTAWIQPAIFMIEVSLATLVRGLGIEPAAVIGQCLGEIAAAHVAGCLSLEDAARISCVRSRIVQRISGRGKMVVTSLRPADAARLITGREQHLAMAVSSPTSTVLTGDAAQIEQIIGELERQGEFAGRIKIDYASHSPQIKPLLPDLLAALQGIKPQTGTIPFYSTVTGQPIDGARLDASYWCRNESEPFLLGDTLGRLIAKGCDVFLDVAPHPALIPAAEQCLDHAGKLGVALPLMRRNGDGMAVLLETLGTLWSQGHQVQWTQLFPNHSYSAERLLELGLPAAVPGASNPSDSTPTLLPLSANSPAALKELAGAMGKFLIENPKLAFSDIAYTAAMRRSHLPHRWAVVGSTKQQWAEQLQVFATAKTPADQAQGIISASQENKLVFVFPGQGGQWLAMGKQLLTTEPVFRQRIGDCALEMQKYCDWSLTEVLAGTGKAAALERVDVIQPALFAMQVALGALLESWGVAPAAVVGHSMGEVAAAYVGGWLNLEEACRVICQRSKLVRTTSGQGAMALVELPEAETRAALKGYAEKLAIGAINGPRTTVISGEVKAVAEVLARLEQQGVYCRLVKVDYASHSPQMDRLSEELKSALQEVAGERGQVPLYSTVSGDRNTAKLTGEYWEQNLRQPVQFYAAVQALGRDGFHTFVEINPHPILLPAIEEALRGSMPQLSTIGVMRRDQGGAQELLTALGSLYVQGRDLDWSKLHPQSGRVVALPSYPWQRARYYIENPTRRARPPRLAGRHPLLGVPTQLSTDPSTRIFELELDGKQLPYLLDHRVAEEVVLPGTAYLEMARAAAETVFQRPPSRIETVVLQEMMILEADSPKTMQLVLKEENPERLRFEVASREESSGTWRRHCGGWLVLEKIENEAATNELSAIFSRCQKRIATRDFYTELSAQGLGYRAAFQTVVELFSGPAEAIGKVRLAEQESGAYALHPALLDGCLQVVMAASGKSAAGPRVPVAIAAVRLHRRLASTVWSHVQLRAGEAGNPSRIQADIRIFAEGGELLAELVGIELLELKRAPASRVTRHLQTAWRLAALPEPRKSARAPRFLLLADESGIAEALSPRLQAHGATADVLTVTDTKVLERMLKAGSYSAVVQLGNLDAPAGSQTSIASLDKARDRDCGSVLEVLHALARLGLRDAPRLWLVTRGVHAMGTQPGPLSPAGGMLWGLGRTIAYEYPELQCTRLDLAPTTWSGELAALERELQSNDLEEEVALRENGRFVARLVWEPAVTPNNKRLLRSDATYLITGGLGGLGLAAAKWLVEQGAKHLVLVGRHGADSLAQKTEIAALEKAGAVVVPLQADVSQRGEMESVFQRIAKQLPALRGVVHAAGVLDDGLLAEQDVKRFANVMSSKVAGAWNLHELTQPLELDFFVLYSSVVALLGSPGQGNYAAANSFLDALAHYRQSIGLQAVSINWGTFTDVGLAAAQDNRGQRLSSRGLTGFSAAQGTAELAKILLDKKPQVGVVGLDLRQWVEFYPQLAASTLLSELLQEARQAGPKGVTSQAVQQTLRAASRGERVALLEKYLGEQLGQVVRMEPQQINRGAPFKSLGVDSLMGLEFRNRLESGLGLKLSAALIWTYPDVGRLAQYLAGCFADRAAPTPPEVPTAEPSRIETSLDEMSDSELARLGDELLA